MVSDRKCLKKNKVKVRSLVRVIKMLLPLKFNISCVLRAIEDVPQYPEQCFKNLGFFIEGGFNFWRSVLLSPG